MSRVQRLVGESGAFIIVGALFAVLAIGFVLPWRSAASATGLSHYQPAVDGHSYLSLETAADGTETWVSGNVRRVPVLRALNEWRTGPRNALREFLSGGEELSEDELVARFRSAAAIETRERLLAPDGTVTERINYVIRDSQGDWLVALYDTAQRQDTVFDPPLLTAPTDLGPDSTWGSEGTVGAAQYTHDVAVTEAGPHRARLGAFEDCLKLESALKLTAGEGQSLVDRSVEWVCAEAGGSVGYTQTSEGSEGERSSVTLVTEDRPATASPPAPASAGSDEPALEGAEDWELVRVGRTSRSGDATESTIPPVHVPGDDPLVLAASHAGDLVAFAAAPGSDVRWRFRSGGTVYGTPTVDPTTGRIFFGATDKRLYALDRNGLFLWAHRTGDSVATRPLVADDVVIFGSEDRRIYAVDAATGERRWSYDAKDAVVSSPAMVHGVVAIGSDSGGVVALDPRTGTRRWQYDVGEAVEAPIGVARDAFVMAGNEGVVLAVDARTGDELWTAELDSGVRAAPTASGDSVLLVDDGAGDVHALDAGDGTLQWSTSGAAHVGPVVVSGESVVAAREDGTVALLDLATGAEQMTWDAADSAGTSDRAPAFELGLTAGGGAVWMADADSVVRRLGPPLANHSGPEALQPAWFKSFSDEPYSGTFSSRPAVDGDDLIVLDGAGNVLRTAAATGEARQLGGLEYDTGTLTGPVIDDDRLFTVAGAVLYGVSYPGIEQLWTYEAVGHALHSPVVVEDLVVYAITDQGNGSDTVSATVHAVDAGTGDGRWTATVDGVGAGIGVSAADGVLFIGGAALDAATGRQLWRHDTGPLAAVGGVASQDGVHYLSLLNPATDESWLTALSADGTEVWTTAAEDVLAVSSTPLISDDTVVINGLSGSVAGYDRLTGEQRWSWSGAAGVLGSVAVIDGQVWAATTDARVTVLDVDTGTEAAQFSGLDLELEPWASVQQPAAAGGRVVVPLGALLMGFEMPGGP